MNIMQLDWAGLVQDDKCGGMSYFVPAAWLVRRRRIVTKCPRRQRQNSLRSAPICER